MTNSVDNLLNWSGDFDSDDMDDAIDHINLMKNRRMEKHICDIKLLEKKQSSSIELVPTVFKNKSYGWLKALNKNSWAKQFLKIYDKDISKILIASRKKGISMPIIIDDVIADGLTRIVFAYSVGEDLPVGYFKSCY